MAFPQQQRLKGSDIEVLKKKGEKKSTPFFHVFLLPSHSQITKVGVIVSSKITSEAVERNKIRRRIQEAARKVLAEFSKKISPKPTRNLRTIPLIQITMIFLIWQKTQ